MKARFCSAILFAALLACNSDPADPPAPDASPADAGAADRVASDAAPADPNPPALVDAAIPLMEEIPPRHELRCACTDGTEAFSCAVHSCESPAGGLTICRRMCKAQGAEDGYPAGCGEQC